MFNIINNKKEIIKTSGIIIAAATVALACSNKIIKITEHEITTPLSELNIVQLSDLHSYNFGSDNINLINKIKKCSPDLIVMTGDIIDAWQPEYEKIEILLKKLNNICPCLYIEGNHELEASNNKRYNEYINNIKKTGIIVLNDEKYELPDKNIVFYGLRRFPELDTLNDIDKNKYNVVLVHDPACAERIAEYEPNLILAGHTHGGQVFIPGIGRIFTHGQGLRAKYIAGKWNIKNSVLIINNGLGSSKLHLARVRINVPPEIININIKKKPALSRAGYFF